MPARYIIAFLEFIPSMNCHAMVIELWEGSKKVGTEYQNPTNTQTIREIKSIYLNKGLGAVREYDRKRWNLVKKPVDTTV